MPNGTTEHKNYCIQLGSENDSFSSVSGMGKEQGNVSIKIPNKVFRANQSWDRFDKTLSGCD